MGKRANTSFKNIKEQTSELGEKAKASASNVFGKSQDEDEVETSAANGSARRSA